MAMEEYYRKRALEYEAIYHRDDPVRREELNRIADAARVCLRKKCVLEIACGTGFWTQIVSEVADRVVAVDVSREMLDVARKKKYVCEVDFVVGDSYCPAFKEAWFGGGLATFWFSHVPKSKIDVFLRSYGSVLGKGSVLFMVDNVYVAGVGGELVAKGGEINTYKLRSLGDGSEFLVVKNYYSVDMLVDFLSPYAKEFSSDNVWFGKHYWYVFCELR